jgi:hypothetical protein
MYAKQTASMAANLKPNSLEFALATRRNLNVFNSDIKNARLLSTSATKRWRAMEVR